MTWFCGCPRGHNRHADESLRCHRCDRVNPSLPHGVAQMEYQRRLAMEREEAARAKATKP